MSRVELELDFIKLYQEKLKETYGETNVKNIIHRKLLKFSDAKLRAACNTMIDHSPYMINVVNQVKSKDIVKDPNLLIEDIFQHTHFKADVSRNMLHKLFEEDPVNFSNNKDVEKVLKNNVAWPKGYIPVHHPINKM
jgi:hypothetical protein